MRLCTRKQTNMMRGGKMLKTLLCDPFKLCIVSFVMCLQKVETVLHNHIVPHTRLD